MEGVQDGEGPHKANPCSFLTGNDDECYKRLFTRTVDFGHKRVMESFSDTDRKIMMLRFGNHNVVDICQHHEMKYLHQYTHLYGKFCCNPYQKHKKITSAKGSQKITLDLAEHNTSLNLVPANFRKVCLHKSDFLLDEEWTYFATSHG